MIDWEQQFLDEDTPWERGAIHPVARDWFNQSSAGPDQSATTSIIIPGCGRSHEPLFLAQQAYQITGLDLSPTAITWQQRRFADKKASGNFVQASLLEWSPEMLVDAVYEQTCLCALEREDQAGYATQIYRWLKPGGTLYANFMQRPGEESGPPFDCPIPVMRDLFPASKWRWLDDKGVRTDRTGENHELGYRLEKRS